jgi:hypothetical protein
MHQNTNNKIIRENEFECNMHADHDDLAITSKTNSWRQVRAPMMNTRKPLAQH